MTEKGYEERVAALQREAAELGLVVKQSLGNSFIESEASKRMRRERLERLKALDPEMFAAVAR